jgi:MFS family permease
MLDSFTTFQHSPRDVRLYTWAWGLLGFGYFGIFGVLFNLYLLRLGYGPETIGLLVGAGQFVWGLAAIPAGLVGGRIGNRNAVILGIGILAVTTGLLLCAEILPISLQTGWIAAWWISSWVGSSLMIVNGVPYVMEVTPEGERRDTFAIQQAVLGLFGFVGSLAAGLLPGLFANLTSETTDSPTVYWYALWLAPLSYLSAMLLMRRTRPLPSVRKEAQGSYDAAMPLFVILFVGLIVFLQTSGEGTIRAFFNVYLDTSLQVPISRIGVVMGLGQFLPIVSSLAAPLVMARWGTAGTIMLTGAVTSLFMVVLAFFAHWAAASIGYIGILLTISISAVARNLFSQEIVVPQWRTVMSAAFTVGLALGWASAAGLGGYLIAAYGYRTLFLLGAVLALASSLLLWGYMRVRARAQASASANLHPIP